MIIKQTRKFQKTFEKLGKTEKRKFAKQFALFVKNIFHPSLNTEKLEPKSENIWSFRIDKFLRVMFTFENGNKIVFLSIGSHDIYRKK